MLMATPTSLLVRYTDRLKQWKDTVFRVPIQNIYKISDYPCGCPLVGDTILVKTRNRLGRMLKWSGMVVSEHEVMQSVDLLERGDPDEIESPGPPGSMGSCAGSIVSHEDDTSNRKRPLSALCDDGDQDTATVKKKPRKGI